MIVVEYSTLNTGTSEPGPFLRVDIGNGRVSRMTTGLLDSGASMTAVPEEILLRLNAQEVDTTTVRLATGLLVRSPVFSVNLRIPVLQLVPGVRVLATSAETHALIGRDVLKHLIVTLDGRNQQLFLLEP